MRLFLLVALLSIPYTLLAQNHRVKCDQTAGCKLYKEEGTMRNGMREGHWKYNYPCLTGHRLHQEGNYENGKKTGVWKSYSPHGDLNSAIAFVNDLEHGEAIHYYPSGKVKGKDSYLNGKLTGDSRTFYEDGKIQSIFTMRSGEYKSYHYNGKLKSSGKRNSSNRNEGEWKEYHENGSIKATGLYKDGEKTGTWKVFHENGKLKGEGEMKKHLRIGHWKLYHDNGQLSGRGEYEQDGYPKPNTWVTYDINGKPNLVNAPAPTQDQIIGLVHSVNTAKEYEGPYHFSLSFQERLWRLAGANPNEYLPSFPVKKYDELKEIAGYQKVTRFWNQYKTMFWGEAYNSSLASGKNILKFAVDSRLSVIFLDGIRKYRMDFNFIDPRDGETVLDYISYRIQLEKKRDRPQQDIINDFERMYKMLREYGVKHAKELK